MPSLPGFIGPSYTSRSVDLAADRLVNLYPEVVEAPRGKHVAAYYGTPGLRKTHTLTAGGPVRDIYTESRSQRVFAVQQNKLFELHDNGTQTDRGTLSGSGTGHVCMADNGTQLVIVDGNAGYVLTLASNAFAQITDPDFPATKQIRYLDGYFIFTFPGTGKFGVTALFDATTVDALDFATAEGNPDDLVATLVDHRELWLFGTRTTEVWFNSGDVDFPFDRIQGAYIEYGCGASFSVANLDNTVYWLGSDERGQHMVFQAQGYQPRRISTHAVEHAIAGYANASVSNARAYAYQQEGHSFYVLNFDEATWAYDVATGLWHERARLKTDGSLSRHRAQCYTAGLGKNLVGDFEDGRIYELDLGTYTDDGDEIVRMRRCPHFADDDLQWLFHHDFQLDVESGVGRGDGVEPGVTPQLILRFSDDGGHTWSNEKYATAGKLGNYRTRARWRRLGKSRDRVYEIRQSDPVKTVWINAKLNATAGIS